MLTCPTLRPKPRSSPRMLSSRSRSLPNRSLRPTSRARISWAGTALQCTGRYQPMRSNWAMPRASLRSVLTTMAESAALTWRVSSSTASNPAFVSPACSHWLSGPASSPILATCSPSSRQNPTSASGSLGNLGLAHDLAGRVDDADAASFQRDIDPDIVLHGRLPMMLGADLLGPRDIIILGTAT